MFPANGNEAMKKSVFVGICGFLALIALGCSQGRESAGTGEAAASTFGQTDSGPHADFRMSTYAGGAPAKIEFANRASALKPGCAPANTKVNRIKTPKIAPWAIKVREEDGRVPPARMGLNA